MWDSRQCVTPGRVGPSVALLSPARQVPPAAAPAPPLPARLHRAAPAPPEERITKMFPFKGHKEPAHPCAQGTGMGRDGHGQKCSLFRLGEIAQLWYLWERDYRVSSALIRDFWEKGMGQAFPGVQSTWPAAGPRREIIWGCWGGARTAGMVSRSLGWCQGCTTAAAASRTLFPGNLSILWLPGSRVSLGSSGAQ